MIPMKPTRLSQLAVVSAGQGAPKDNEFSESGIPFVRAGSLEGLLSGKNESELEHVSPETAKLRKLKTYPKGTILFAKSGMSATKDRVYVLQSPAHVVSHLATLIPKDGAHVDYLRLALKRFPPSLLIKDPAYPAIALGEIENFEIPVPEELDNQIRIADLLGKVEGLIAQCKQHLQQLDELLKSVFLEMFGDPVRNEKGWDEYPLFKQCPKITDGTHDTPERLTKGVPFITGKHIRPYSIDYSGCDFVSAEDHSIIYSRCDPKYGDVLYTNIGVNLGTAAMNTVHFEFSMKNVALLRPSLQLSSRFLEHYLNFEKVKAKIISDLSSGGAQKFLGLGQIKKIAIIIPPMSLQNSFAGIVEKVEGIKSRYQQSLTDLEALYGALSQKAFKGELDLSRVPLPGNAH